MMADMQGGILSLVVCCILLMALAVPANAQLK
jgi:hypothetical protein